MIEDEKTFINPVQILQMFHDQNLRIKTLEEKLAGQSGKDLAKKIDSIMTEREISASLDLEINDEVLKRVKKCEGLISKIEQKVNSLEATSCLTVEIDRFLNCNSN